MAHSGDHLEIEMAGRIVFRDTAEETNGERLRFEFFIPAGEESEADSARHMERHPQQEECFRVINGRVRGEIDGKELTAGDGEEFVIPPDTWHLFRNDGDEVAHVEVEMRPALRTEDWLSVMAELEVNDKGIPNPFHGAVVMREYRDETRIKGMENPIVKWVLFPILGRI